jgi:hypothetical protein
VLSRTKKLAAICTLTGAAALGFGIQSAHASTAHLATSTDTDDTLAPAGQTVTANISGPFTFNVSTNVFGNFTASCTGVTATFKVPSTGFTTKLIPQPDGQPIDITGCTDSLGGTDTVTSSGTWKIKFVDAANDETSTEPNTDHIKIAVPLDGASFTSSLDPSCVLTLDATSTSYIKTKYNDKGVATIIGGQNPGAVTPGSGCPPGMTVSETLNKATLDLNVPVHDVS